MIPEPRPSPLLHDEPTTIALDLEDQPTVEAPLAPAPPPTAPSPGAVADAFLDDFEDAIEATFDAAHSALRWHAAGRPDPWHGTQKTLLAAAHALADLALEGPAAACRRFGSIFDGVLEPGHWVEFSPELEEPENTDTHGVPA